MRPPAPGPDPRPRRVATLLDLLLPALCLHCETPLTRSRPGLCAPCRESLAPLPPGCLRCGLPRPGNPGSCARCRAWPEPLSAVAATRYDGAARSLVRALKYEGWRHLAELAAGQMAAALADRGECPDVLTPVPLHPVRRRARGYNQAELLARELARVLDRPCADLVARTRATAPQVGLTRAGRAENVAGAFRPAGRPAGPIVGLVDDVATSGATLAATAEVLVAAGAERVVGATFALALDLPRG